MMDQHAFSKQLAPSIMRKIFTIGFIIACLATVHAQEEPAPIVPANKNLYVQAGLQTGVLLDFYNDDEQGSSLVRNPYLLMGKVGLGNIAIRAGVGGSHKKKVDKEEGFANSLTDLHKRLDVRLGLERRMHLGKRWTGFYGLDIIGHWTQNKLINDSGFDVITDSEDEQYIGGGLVTGIQFRATKRLCFATEGFVYYTKGKLTNGQFFKNFPVGDDEITKSDIAAIQIGLPSSLYLILEF